MYSIPEESSLEGVSPDLGAQASSALMKHIWIIEKISSRLVFYHDFQGTCDLDGILISGLLSALQSFSEYELQEHGIENIDMGGLRWVYASFPQSNLLMVAAGPKNINPSLTLERVRIIHNIFIQEFEIDETFWKTWDSMVTPFKGFSETVSILHDQWYKAQKLMDVGRLFDLLRIFQEIFIHLIQFVEEYIPVFNRSHFLHELRAGMKNLENQSSQYSTQEFSDSDRIITLFLPQINLQTQTITFSQTHAMELYSLNPIGFDEKRLKAIFFPVFKVYRTLIKQYTGEIRWKVSIKPAIMAFLIKKWDLLQDLKLLKDLFQLFM